MLRSTLTKENLGCTQKLPPRTASFKGYVKPIIKDLDVLGHEDRNDNIFRKMWEGLVGFVGQVFKNQPEDQVATKIPFEGVLRS